MAATSRSDKLESRRRAYLDALGIPLYHPRQQLPGALPSARLASLPSALATAAAPPVKPDSVSPAPSAAANRPAAQTLMAQLQKAAAPASRAPSIPATPAATVTPPISAAPPAAKPGRVAERPEATPAAVMGSPGVQAETAAFSFAFIPVSEQVAVINELPTAGAPVLTPGSRQLLAGILKALTLPIDERNLSSQSFVWPSPDLPPTEQGPAPARELLKGFLARRFSIRPVRYLLVLAEQGAPYLFPAGFAINEGQLFQHPEFDVQVLTTRSLAAMEAVPALKREVWSALQPLLRALQGSADETEKQQRPERRQDP